METQEQKTPMREMALRAIAVLGLIAVLLLGAWGIIQLAVAIPGLFSNIGSGSGSLLSPSAKKEMLNVSAASTISSGQSLQVSWSHTNASGEYSYTLSYACQNGLSVKAPLPTGTYQAVACNTPFNYTNAADHMIIVPSATGANLPLVLTVSAIQLSSGAVTVQNTVTTNVAPAAATTPATKAPATKAVSGNTTAYYPAPVQKALYGYPDLAVSINSVTPSVNGLTSVVFTIQNVGTNVAPGGWTFNATLPINGSYMFASQAQRALNPGDKIKYTLTFSGASNNYNGSPYGYANGYGYTGAGYYTGAGSYSGTSNYTCTGYVPCFQQSNDPIDYTSGAYNYGTNYNYSQPYNYGYSTGPVTITVDPQNYILESNEYNNTSTAY